MAQFGYNPYGYVMDMFDGPQRVAQDPPPNGIGSLYPNEHCLDLQNYIPESIYPYQIYAVCRIGGWRLAYSDLRAWPLSNVGVTYWFQHNLRVEYLFDRDHYIFGIRRDAKIYNNNGSQYGTLHGAYEIACWTTDGCLPHDTNRHWVRVRAWRAPDANWIKGDFWVDTGIREDSNSPAVWGNGF